MAAPPPATPNKIITSDTVSSSSKLPAVSAEKNPLSKAKQAGLHEPSPASTYGETTSGSSVPATPGEMNGESPSPFDSLALALKSFRWLFLALLNSSVKPSFFATVHPSPGVI